MCKLNDIETQMMHCDHQRLMLLVIERAMLGAVKTTAHYGADGTEMSRTVEIEFPKERALFVIDALKRINGLD